VKNWSHPAKHVKIIERHKNSPHFIQVYTDGSMSDARVGSGIENFSENNLTATLKYRLHSRCTNNQARQMAILKALEHIQYSKTGEKTVLYRQPDNTQNATKQDDTHAPYRTNQDQGLRIGTGRMENGIQLDNGTRRVPKE